MNLGSVLLPAPDSVCFAMLDDNAERLVRRPFPQNRPWQRR